MTETNSSKTEQPKVRSYIGDITAICLFIGLMNELWPQYTLAFCIAIPWLYSFGQKIYKYYEKRNKRRSTE